MATTLTLLPSPLSLSYSPPYSPPCTPPLPLHRPRLKKQSTSKTIRTTFRVTKNLTALQRCLRQLMKSTNLLEFFALISKAEITLRGLREGVEKNRFKRDWFGKLLPGALHCCVYEFMSVSELMNAEGVCKTWRLNVMSPHGNLAWRCAYLANGWSRAVSEQPGVAVRGAKTTWRERVRRRLRVEQNWKLGNSKQKILKHGGEVYAVVFQDNMLATAADCDLKLWDMGRAGDDSCKCVRTFGDDTSSFCGVKLYKKKFVVTGLGDGSINFWNVSSGVCQQVLRGHTDSVWGLALSPFYNRLFSGSCELDASIKEWDIETGTCMRTFQGHSSHVMALNLITNGDEIGDMSSSAHLLVSGSGDRTLRVWDLHNGVAVQTLRGHTGDVYTVNQWGRDGRRVISGSYDCTIRMWELRKGGNNNGCLRVLDGHQGAIRTTAVVSESKRIISGSYDSTIKLWDPERGICLRTLTDHKAWVLTLDSDSVRLISGDSRGKIVLRDFGAVNNRPSISASFPPPIFYPNVPLGPPTPTVYAVTDTIEE